MRVVRNTLAAVALFVVSCAVANQASAQCPLPDLVVTQVRVLPASCRGGRLTVPVKVTVKNIDVAHARGFKVALRAHLLGPSSPLASSIRPLSGLAPGASANIGFTINLPKKAMGKQAKFGAFADCTRIVRERSEGNNKKYRVAKIKVTGPCP